MNHGETTLSAAEGADRVARRFRQLRRSQDQTGEDETAAEFRFENCGGHYFVLLCEFETSLPMRSELACSCGHSDEAAKIDFVVKQTHRQTDTIGQDHRVDYEEENSDEPEREEEDREIECEECFAEPDPEDWTTEELDEAEVDEESRCYEVQCRHCGHEVEFGWSHENLGGRIWPSESSDFNPWLTFPEPRFVENWKKRGWIHPN